jgi:cytochrome c peroxidase
VEIASSSSGSTKGNRLANRLLLIPPGLDRYLPVAPRVTLARISRTSNSTTPASRGATAALPTKAGSPYQPTRATNGAFKTPTLREIARTSPYVHDGSFARLDDVIEFCSEGGRPNAYVDAEIRPRHFSPEEKRALVAFLQSLNGRLSEGVR